MKKILIAFMLTSTFIGCKKGEVVPPPEVVTVAERLEITPLTSSILNGQTAQFAAKFFNNQGVLANLPATAIWSSSSTGVATINNQGLATGLSVGQTNIKISYNNISATAVLNIVANNNVIANINISPNATQEILLNGTSTLSAMGTNVAGATISGLTFTWVSDAANVTVNNNGIVTGTSYGTANVTASSNGITSAPVMVQVIRQGNFAGANSMGTAKLKIENGTLKLTTSANFSFSTAAPDLRIYLTNSLTSVANAVQISPLTSAGIAGGARTWNVPTGVNITQYRYALIWCAQFTGNYGAVDFGL